MEDIPLLAAHLLHEFDPAGDVGFDSEALAKLSEHAWPGNVRELRNVVQRAVVLCEGNRIRAADVQF